MSVSDFGKVCLFSAISGVITLDGVPVTNARLVRTADRNGPLTDETHTDEKGYFKFPAVFERTVTKYLPQEFVASQKIVSFYQGKEYVIWNGVKRSAEENLEARGKQLKVKCELKSDVNYVDIGGSFFHTLCIWDVKSDPPIDWEKTGFFDKE